MSLADVMRERAQLLQSWDHQAAAMVRRAAARLDAKKAQPPRRVPEHLRTDSLQDYLRQKGKM